MLYCSITAAKLTDIIHKTHKPPKYHFAVILYPEGWHQKSPPAFLFSVKAPRAITHYQKFTPTARQLREFYQLVATGLQEKLGPVLFQLPAALAFSPELPDRITGQLDPQFQNVVECRHASWWTLAVFDPLAQHGISFCGISHPQLPREAVINTPPAYYRFHGTPQLYRSTCRKKFLENIACQLTHDKQAKQAFLYFNNTANGAALRNATWLRDHALTSC